ncbi:MAG: hypothetical protein HY982_02575 [Candidatus Magasanikbacteria bacterium]|nr:hypothetical protein [Candidatus Magasanikbacteria bacterium]
MDNIKTILAARQKKKNKNLHSEIHYLADVISRYFGEKKKFAMYLGVVKRLGVSEARRLFSEVRDAHCFSPAKLFLWKAKKKKDGNLLR